MAGEPCDPPGGAWTVLVCGDRHRSDDGAALVAADRLDDILPTSVVVRRVGQLGPDDLVAGTAGGPCVVLDAVRGVDAGCVVAAPLAGLRAGGPATASSHALPLPTVIALADALGAELERATFLGIGGERFDLGEGLSPAVERGLNTYAAIIAGTVRRAGIPGPGELVTGAIPEEM